MTKPKTRRTQREMFEAWTLTHIGVDKYEVKRLGDGYCSTYTDAQWLAWQAAVRANRRKRT